MNQADPSSTAITADKRQHAGRWKLFAILAICAAPMIASYFTYYVLKPQARTNYGDFIQSETHPIPADLGSTSLDGKPVALKDFEGKWIMLQIDDGACAEPCRKKLTDMRQLRLAQGRERDRIERLWLITDAAPLDTVLMREFDGTRMLRANAVALAKWLPVEPGATIADHIYLIDPLGRLMMRFPKNRDPNLIKKDLSKLLRASSIG
ncbi:cytochrome oxidase Cu insertion factor (SCO1/SenC/PrrC family) [Actimicrobium sp. GrIS 1.19]|uniref:SCO family protein n=1 Tax=Actimicrobium sp. GrIS 1.19 TaxID=3071708 RepID=UPI002E01356D|nr:cytochrome oxidase Cu insertion factor (SCO1/SenC/PrrC family) [Actimicrobium sp. GrIS 1.19]